MDLAKTLIRSVVRAFYDKRQVLIIDALLVHSALPNDELAILMGMQQKDLRKACGKLREDKMMVTHARQELREGQQRPINREYYYVDFHTTIDAIKYRVFNLTRRVQALYQPSEERKDFHCPRCKANWTQLEVLDRVGPEGFECHRCFAVLERDERAAEEATGHEKHGRLMSQLERLLSLMRQIDEADIPKNDFESAFAVAVPIPRDEQVNPQRQTIPVNATNAKPTTVKGVIQAAAPLGISLTTASEKTAAEQEAEVKRKAEDATRNKLPEWISTSTVTGEVSAVGLQEQERQSHNVQLAASKVEEDEKKDDLVADDDLTDYYAQLADDRAKEAQEDEDSDEEDDDDDEEEFEDVAIDASEAATPSSFTSAGFGGSKDPLPNGNMKRQSSESGISALGTGSLTPAGSQSLQIGDTAPPVKKARFEGTENGVEVQSDEDDEAEFEDAL